MQIARKAATQMPSIWSSRNFIHKSSGWRDGAAIRRSLDLAGDIAVARRSVARGISRCQSPPRPSISGFIAAVQDSSIAQNSRRTVSRSLMRRSRPRLGGAALLLLLVAAMLAGGRPAAADGTVLRAKGCGDKIFVATGSAYAMLTTTGTTEGVK